MQLVSSGADGLVKLWGVRSAECTATFDEHEGKVAAPTALFTVLAGVVTGRQRVCRPAVRHTLFRTDAVPLLRFIALPAVHTLGVLHKILKASAPCPHVPSSRLLFRWVE